MGPCRLIVGVERHATVSQKCHSRAYPYALLYTFVLCRAFRVYCGRRIRGINTYQVPIIKWCFILAVGCVSLNFDGRRQEKEKCLSIDSQKKVVKTLRRVYDGLRWSVFG